MSRITRKRGHRALGIRARLLHTRSLTWSPSHALTLSCNGCGRCDVHHKIVDWVKKPAFAVGVSLQLQIPQWQVEVLWYWKERGFVREAVPLSVAALYDDAKFRSMTV
jgi:hypothetical protein